MEKRKKDNCYTYMHLISGVDLPLKSQDEIHDFFDRNNGENFMRFDDVNAKRICHERMGYYYWLQEFVGSRRFGKFYIYLDKVLVKIQQFLHVNRIKNLKEDLYYGSNWVSITPNAASILLSKRNFIEKYFRYTYCCDEIYKHIILRNAGIRIHSLSPNHAASNKRFIEFSQGKSSPTILCVKDFFRLKSSEAFWGRKFDENVDSEIIEMIYTDLCQKAMKH